MPDDDNAKVIHLPRDIPPLLEELTETVDVISRCLAEIGSERRCEADFDRVMVTPILLHMAAVEQWLEKLDEINVTTWPDVRWALYFCHARIQALSCIRASTTPSCSQSPPAWGEDVAIVDAHATIRTLRGVRDLIVERYPQTRPAC